MRRLLRQSGSLALTLLFGVSLASSAFGWHGCPHHDRGSSDGSARGARATESAGTSASRHARARRHETGQRERPRSGTCTCLGSCHAGAAPVLGSNPVLPVVVENEVRTRASRPPTNPPRYRRPAYFLPFPHGPPALG